MDLTVNDTECPEETVETEESTLPSKNQLDINKLSNLIQNLENEIADLKSKKSKKSSKLTSSKEDPFITQKGSNDAENPPVRGIKRLRESCTISTPPPKAKKNAPPVRVETSPVRHTSEDEENEANTAFTPFDENTSGDDENYENNEYFNPYASQTDGYSSEDSNAGEQEYNKTTNKELDISKLIPVPTEEEKTSPINTELSKLIKKNWTSKKPFENMKKIFKKYPCPENCSFEPPKVNTELWKLLSSAQRKADMKLVGIQKSLKKALNANLSLLKDIQENKFSLQSIAQKTVDMAAILGHASSEISLNRRVFIRGVINPQYKDLCASTQPITEHLFGDDLPKLVKELNLTNRIGRHQRVNKKPYDRQYQSRTNRNTNNSFLGRGRGSLPQRHYNNNNNYNSYQKAKKK